MHLHSASVRAHENAYTIHAFIERCSIMYTNMHKGTDTHRAAEFNACSVVIKSIDSPLAGWSRWPCAIASRLHALPEGCQASAAHGARMPMTQCVRAAHSARGPCACDHPVAAPYARSHARSHARHSDEHETYSKATRGSAAARVLIGIRLQITTARANVF